MWRKNFVPALTLLLGVQGAALGVEPIPEQEKRDCPQCFHEYVKYSYRVFLPDGMLLALKKYSPTFRIFGLDDYSEELRLKLQPWSTNLMSYSAVFQDFNGDGRFDAAVFGEYTERLPRENELIPVSQGLLPSGKESRKFVVLAILSRGTTDYSVGEVTRIGTSREVSTYLSISSPGKVSDIQVDAEDNPTASGPTFNAKNYGINVTTGVGTTVYYMDNKTGWFRGFITGGL